MWQTCFFAYLDSSVVASKNDGVPIGAYTRTYAEVDTLHTLIVCPCGNTFRVLVEAYDATIRTDVERTIAGIDDALHAVVGERAVALVVSGVVVLLLIVNQQSVVMRTDIYGSV